MTKPPAIRATYSDWKLIRTRGVVQLVFEVPLSEADVAYEVIGGMPDPSKERWFAIAALQAEASAKVIKIPDRRHWPDVPADEQAGIRCNEPTFVNFLKDKFAADWEIHSDAAATVRWICGVKSRAELGTDSAALAKWRELDRQFLMWWRMERES